MSARWSADAHDAQARHHYYVYFRSKDGAYLFDRTCGTERRAAERVGELVKEYKHDQAIYVKNHLIAGAFY